MSEAFDGYVDPSAERAWFLIPLLAWGFSYAQNLLEGRGLIRAPSSKHRRAEAPGPLRLMPAAPIGRRCGARGVTQLQGDDRRDVRAGDQERGSGLGVARTRQHRRAASLGARSRARHRRVRAGAVAPRCAGRCAGPDPRHLVAGGRRRDRGRSLHRRPAAPEQRAGAAHPGRARFSCILSPSCCPSPPAPSWAASWVRCSRCPSSLSSPPP